MKNTTRFLPGFHLSTLRRTPRTRAQILACELEKIKQHSISQLALYFSKMIPNNLLKNNTEGHFSRRRLFSKSNIFWAFFSQVLDSDGGCQEAVRKVQAHIANKTDNIPSTSTSAYCQARKNIDINNLKEILAHTSSSIQEKNLNWKNHRVIVVDGTGLSAPDTVENQKEFPQQKTLKVGCGFPQIRAMACFCLHTGGLLSYELGNKKIHEVKLLRKQHKTFKSGDILLGDKAFGSYYDFSKFLELGVNCVISHAIRKPKTASNACKVLGKDDLLIQWTKPRSRNGRYSKEEFSNLPKQLVLRQIKVTVKTSSFRVKSFHIITSLTDSTKYSAAEIADLYFQRWDVELFFRDIKTTMNMDVLRCKTPEMIEKEILMHFIVYNCIRSLMVEASISIKKPPRIISFKASIQALRQWQQIVNSPNQTLCEVARNKAILVKAIADSVIYQRPNRREPRCLKRRRHKYDLMTKPRHQMQEIPHNGRKYGKRA